MPEYRKQSEEKRKKNVCGGSGLSFQYHLLQKDGGIITVRKHKEGHHPLHYNMCCMLHRVLFCAPGIVSSYPESTIAVGCFNTDLVRYVILFLQLQREFQSLHKAVLSPHQKKKRKENALYKSHRHPHLSHQSCLRNFKKPLRLLSLFIIIPPCSHHCPKAMRISQTRTYTCPACLASRGPCLKPYR